MPILQNTEIYRGYKLPDLGRAGPAIIWPQRHTHLVPTLPATLRWLWPMHAQAPLPPSLQTFWPPLALCSGPLQVKLLKGQAGYKLMVTQPCPESHSHIV